MNLPGQVPGMGARGWGYAPNLTHIILSYFSWKRKDPVLSCLFLKLHSKKESGNYSALPFPWPTPRWTQGLIM